MEQRSEANGLTLKAYHSPGQGLVLLAFDVAESLVEQLAGFAVRHSDPAGREYWIQNRLSFATPTGSARSRRPSAVPSNVAPIQRFHVTHTPSDPTDGQHVYTATAMLFARSGSTDLVPGPAASVYLDLVDEPFPKFDFGFTRGSLYSDAYAERFRDAPIAPQDPSIDFDTKPFEDQYRWLGAKARRLVFDILEEALNDPATTLDVFAYDLNEPDVIRALARLGPRLRIFLDNAQLHSKADSKEMAARRVLESSAGPAHVRAGHFRRFAHCKALILKRGGSPVKALTGSANFTLGGLYGQTNAVFVFDDPQAAALYEQAFEQAWMDPSRFAESEIAGRWFDVSAQGVPACSLSFSPHRNADVALAPIAQAIRAAKSSVLFSIMSLRATSPVVSEILSLPDRRDLCAFGTTQQMEGASPDPDSPFVLMRGEGGVAMRPTTASFVVCDFNAEEPVLYAGSSNFTMGGETQNGDNVIAFRDREIATAFAVKAVELVDHHRFLALRQVTKGRELFLKGPGEQWAAPYFDPSRPAFLERQLFARATPYEVEADALATPRPTGRPEAKLTDDRWTTDDELGYDVYVDVLTEIIQNPDTPTPLAISIKGNWGSGKTSLMRMLRIRLDGLSPDGEDPTPASGGDADGSVLARVLRKLIRLPSPNGERAAPGDAASGETSRPTNREVLDELRKPPERRNLIAGPAQPTPLPAPEAEQPEQPEQPDKPRRKDLPTIWFNAWIYQSSRQLWAGLAVAIMNGVANRLPFVERERFWLTLQIRRVDGAALRRRLYRELAQRILPSVAGLIVASLAAAAFAGTTFLPLILVGPVYGWLAKAKLLRESLATAFSDLVREPDYATEAGFLHLFHRDMKLILEVAGVSEEKPLVIFVDDLDRCSYSTVADVVEGLNLFLAGGFQNCIVVIGMEPTLVAAQLGVAYRDLFTMLSGDESSAARIRYGWKFLEKMVQLPLALPAPRKARLEQYVGSLTSYGTDGEGTGLAAFEQPDEDEIEDRTQAIREKLESQGGGMADVAEAARAVDAPEGGRPVSRATVAAARRVVSDLATEDNQEMRTMYRNYAGQLSGNPREFKRFLNLFRFYANLQVTEELGPSSAPSLEQIGKISMLAVRWPELVGGFPNVGERTPVAALESLAGKHKTVAAWSAAVKKEQSLPAEVCDLLLQDDVHAFLRQDPSIGEYADGYL